MRANILARWAQSPMPSVDLNASANVDRTVCGDVMPGIGPPGGP